MPFTLHRDDRGRGGARTYRVEREGAFVRVVAFVQTTDVAPIHEVTFLVMKLGRGPRQDGVLFASVRTDHWVVESWQHAPDLPRDFLFLVDPPEMFDP